MRIGAPETKILTNPLVDKIIPNNDRAQNKNYDCIKGKRVMSKDCCYNEADSNQGSVLVKSGYVHFKTSFLAVFFWFFCYLLLGVAGSYLTMWMAFRCSPGNKFFTFIGFPYMYPELTGKIIYSCLPLLAGWVVSAKVFSDWLTYQPYGMTRKIIEGLTIVHVTFPAVLMVILWPMGVPNEIFNLKVFGNGFIFTCCYFLWCMFVFTLA